LRLYNNMRDNGTGAIVVKDRGALYWNDDDRVANFNPASITFEPGSRLILSDDNQAYNTGDNETIISRKADISWRDDVQFNGTEGLVIGAQKSAVGWWNNEMDLDNGGGLSIEAGATWARLAPMAGRWMRIRDEFNGNGADVYVGNDVAMWTSNNWDDHTRQEAIPRGHFEFENTVSNIGTLYVQGEVQMWHRRANLDGVDIVVQGSMNNEGGLRLQGNGWRLTTSTVTTEDQGAVWIENWSGDTKFGSLFINNNDGLRFQGGEEARIVTQLGGAGSVKTGQDGHIRMLAGSNLTPGDSSDVSKDVGTLSVDDLFTDAGFNYVLGVGLDDSDSVSINDRLELANAWTLKLDGVGGFMVPTTEYDLFTYGGSYAGTAGDITGEVTIDKADVPTWDITGAAVMQTAGRVYVTGIDGLQYRYWKDQDGDWGDTTTPPLSVNWADGASADASVPDAAIGTLATIDRAGRTATVASVGQSAFQVDLDAGSLVVSGAGELTTTGYINVATGAALDVQLGGVLNSTGVNSAGALTLGGGGTIGSLNATGGSVDITSATTTFGDVTIASGASVAATVAMVSTGDTSIGGTLDTNSNVTAGGKLILDGAGDNIITVTGTSVFSGSGDITSINNNPNLTVTGSGDLTIKGPQTLDGEVNALLHYGYHTGPNGVMDLDNNNAGGMMGGGDPTQGPTFHGQALLIDGPGGRGLDFNDDTDFINTGAIGQNDNYSNMWFGYIRAPQTGTYEFRNMGDDDRGGIWLDLDQDGVFESSAAGLGSNRGEQLSWEDGGWKAVDLTAGEQYMIAFTHSEGGGGSRADFAFHAPHLPNQDRRVKPGDLLQDGLWATAPLTPGGIFGDLNVHGGGVLTLDGVGTATFESIAAGDGAIINGDVAVTGAVTVGSSAGTLAVNGSLMGTAP